MPVAVGDLVLGLRTNDSEVLDVARALVAEHVVDGSDAAPNVSLWVAPEDESPARQLHRLYRRGIPVLRTKSLRRLVLGGIAMLESFGRVPDHVLAVDARLLVRARDRAAILVGDEFGIALDHLHEGRLRRLGWELTETVRPQLDRDSLDVVVPEPTLQLAAAGLARLDALERATDTGDAARAGRYQLHAILAVSVFEVSDFDTWSPATRVAHFSQFARDIDGTLRIDDLDVMRRAVARVPVQHVAANDARAVLDAIKSVD